MEHLSGIVIRSTGSSYKVITPDNQVYDCKIKGKFRLEGIKATNPVAIGDKVHFHSADKRHFGLIDVIEERKNALIRKSLNLSSRSHILAANLDFAVLVVSLRQPNIKPEFIDRFFVVAEAYNIRPALVINKIDLLTGDEQQKLEFFNKLYTGLGYPVVVVSSVTGENYDELRQLFHGRVSLVAGQSGVGKSTILNRLQPELNLKTAMLAKYTGKGRHTTSFYEMFRLWENTYVIDSPGIKEMGLYGFELYEISLFYPDFKKYVNECRFNTCLHINEPDCGVKAALEKGLINPLRYRNYLNIIGEYKKEQEQKSW